MARQMPGIPFHLKALTDATELYSREESISFKPRWYFTKEEIEKCSPSRKDGINGEQESHLRHLYCSYLQELGMELKVPQVTIATAMILCHRFYMHQSHAKNHWQTVANSSMFLACKAEDTPRLLKDLIVMTYKLTYSWDPLASQKIRQKEVYDKQKGLILVGERLILATIAFDLNIEHPYKPLVAALKRLEISQKEVLKVAWNFVNDWLRTTLSLQYKPHYIAAGSVYLAAKLQKIKLPSANGKAWWMQFDVSPKQLEEVIQHMLQLLGQSSIQTVPASEAAKTESKPASRKRSSESTLSCISSSSPISMQDSSNNPLVVKTSALSKPTLVNCKQKQTLNDANKKAESCQTSDCGSANSAVEDGDAELITGDSNQNTGCKILTVEKSYPKIDVTGIREKMKRRKLEKVENKKICQNLENDVNNEGWIERELENGIESISAVS
ncbi:hypothetical protein ACJIZ3_002667 [Penstemon smallii]|uniref:Cyclin-like domain-containing protein n=1 Tax=Penstemon smallii TaxID=265156 RepID=A0ABD3U713_9LAMI